MITNRKKIKSEPQAEQGVPGNRQDSIALLVQVVNRNLKDKSISEDQLQQLQAAVDSVDELLSLDRTELNYVLKSIGRMDAFQMICVRKYLGGLQ